MDGSSTMMPVERSDLRTADIAHAHEQLSRAYVDHRLRLARPGPGFVFQTRTATVGQLGLDRLTYRGAVESTADPFDSVTTVVLLDGWYSVDDGRRHHRFTAGDAYLVPLGSPLTVCWSGIDLQNLRFPLALIRRAAARLGLAAADFRFESPSPVSPAMRRHWIATAGHLVRSFAGPLPAVAHPLIYAGAMNMLAATALAVFPNTTMTVDYVPGPGRVAPATVRRAKAFIDAHAAEPLTLEDVARAAGISVRGLQATFARHGDLTPLGYLRRVRLENAHRDLEAGDRARGDTVAAIARRWGFASPSRFAVDYRKVYGRSPRRTLDV
ncbi:AraC family transcriptional regulator [Actinoplanes sp. CA-131856]